MKSRIVSSPAVSTAICKASALSMTRRFALKRAPSRRRDTRHSGQALLLAVVIMLLAAVLSAGFLAVLSGNLNQTARIGDKTRAIEASRAGVAFANAQLSYSAKGDQWRPVDASPIPATSSAAYANYYSQLDRVQGWATNGFAKFPANEPIGNAPKYLLKVEDIPIDLPDTDPQAEHRGEFKITSIGLSDDDPNVFHRSVAYKEGPKKSPWAQALRSVSNWNFNTSKVPSSEATASVMAPAANIDITVKDASFSDTDAPFNIVITNRTASPATVQGAVVTKVAGTTLTLAKLDNDITAGDTIEKAAAIGTASNIDLLNTGTPTTLATQNQPNGLLINGGAWLQGEIQISTLNKYSTKIFNSGSIALDDTSKPVVAPATLPTPNYGIAGDGTLVSSAATNFPGTFTTDSGADVAPLDLVNDGWNRGTPTLIGLAYSDSKKRSVQPFKPAKIDSKQNLARYRNLARGDAGVYISNSSDIEKVVGAEMTQKQLREMWLSPATLTTDFTRNGMPSTAATDSLEQKHLRGWIGPDEFLPRGALVELRQDGGPNPYIRVTFDPRSDAVPNGPDPNKAARDTTTGDLQPGVYTKDYLWPKDGVIFAEGNIRIRGKVNLPVAPTDGTPDIYPSLTVVSMGNIYIEGSVSVDNTTAEPDRKKLMLLAKKNVVVNPTRSVLGHVDEQTLSTAAATVDTTTQTVTIPVTDVSAPVLFTTVPAFKVGDVVETYDPGLTTVGVRGIVTAATVNSLTLSVLTGTSVASGAAVKTLLQDKSGNILAATSGAPTDTKYFAVDAADAINRRVLLQTVPAPPTPFNLRLALDHLAQRPGTPTFQVSTVADTMKPADLMVKLTNKRVAAADVTFDPRDPLVQTANKLVRATFTAPATGSPDEFPATAPTDETTATQFSLADLEAEMTAKLHPGWKYQVTRDAALAPDDTPFFYLAAIGLRNDKFTSAPVTPDNGIKDIGGDDPTLNSIDIPLATSVRLQRRSTAGALVNETLTAPYTDASNVAANYTVPFLGFNPIYGAPDPSTPVSVEDALSVDQTFYQTDANILNSTLDSRAPSAAFVGGDSLLLRQNNDLLTLPAGVTATLPEYRVRSLKLENATLGATPVIEPITLDIDAFVYAQDGSWFVIPGDYFRSNPTVRGIVDGSGNYIGSYIDYANADPNNPQPDAGEYLDVDGSTTPTAGDVADLNRNGVADPGEAEAALRFVRYNYQINFTGAIVENQTAIVNTVPGATATDPPLAIGAVADWMDKWANYDNDLNNDGTADTPTWKFINYTYDPALANETAGSQTLRVPQTGDLIYEQ